MIDALEGLHILGKGREQREETVRKGKEPEREEEGGLEEVKQLNHQFGI